MTSKAITADAYREAVCEIIGHIRRAHGLADRNLAAKIGCSASTVRNARNRLTSLDPALLLRIEQEFGPGAIDPVLALGNARAVPLPQANHAGNPLLALVAALHCIVEAQARESEGGRQITRGELRQILPSLREGRSALDGLIARAGEC
ncbi:XRE family transcriptional regulator [Alteraurantiacibacter palmitatis]|uniref:XRE family transcriptional regulator n=1 Tax=Alteraurantiacibacter palmitatis TaxID=2054628 RepID=A0ABV7E925_9SPHN